MTTKELGLLLMLAIDAIEARMFKLSGLAGGPRSEEDEAEFESIYKWRCQIAMATGKDPSDLSDSARRFIETLRSDEGRTSVFGLSLVFDNPVSTRLSFDDATVEKFAAKK